MACRFSDNLMSSERSSKWRRTSFAQPLSPSALAARHLDWLFFGIKLLARALPVTVSLADFPLIPLPPYEHLWFLWALFLAQVTVLIAFMAVREVLNIAQMRLCLEITAVMLTLLIPLHVPLLLSAAIEHLPYFIAGMA